MVKITSSCGVQSPTINQTLAMNDMDGDPEEDTFDRFINNGQPLDRR